MRELYNRHYFFLLANGFWVSPDVSSGGRLFTMSSNDWWFDPAFEKYMNKKNESSWFLEPLDMLGHMLDFVTENPEYFHKKHMTKHGAIGFTHEEIEAHAWWEKNKHKPKRDRIDEISRLPR
jgi:hypothetical protein